MSVQKPQRFERSYRTRTVAPTFVTPYSVCRPLWQPCRSTRCVEANPERRAGPGSRPQAGPQQMLCCRTVRRSGLMDETPSRPPAGPPSHVLLLLARGGNAAGGASPPGRFAWLYYPRPEISRELQADTAWPRLCSTGEPSRLAYGGVVGTANPIASLSTACACALL